MKQYKEYMDSIQVSDTLHRRLLELKAPARRPAAWRKYGAAAAALALVAGVGAWGLGQGGWNALANQFQPAARPENADLGQTDIAIAGPGESLEPGMKTIGGYEVQQGELVAYFMLPYIEFGLTDSVGVGQMALDWDVPPGSVKRDLTQADIDALFGWGDVLSAHLNWGGYTVTGWAAWRADGSFWGAFLNGYKGPLDHFEFAVTAGDVLPPTCIAYGEDGVVNQIWGVPVTAWGHNGKDGCDRRVEFLHDGYGFRFDLTATDADQAGDLMSRLTRWIIVEGVAADSITADGTVLANPWDGLDSAPGEPAWPQDGSGSINDYDSDCPYCVDGTVHTHPYDPGKPAEAVSPVPPKGPDDPGAGNLPDGDPAAYEPQAELP